MSRGGFREGAGRPASFEGGTIALGVRVDKATADKLRQIAKSEKLTVGKMLEKIVNTYAK